MKRSGGRAGRPFGHMSIVEMENAVQSSPTDKIELTTILGELGFRNTKRAYELKSLVQRLLRDIDDPKADDLDREE